VWKSDAIRPFYIDRNGLFPSFASLIAIIDCYYLRIIAAFCHRRAVAHFEFGEILILALRKHEKYERFCNW
jgi:hypothetical protein